MKIFPQLMALAMTLALVTGCTADREKMEIEQAIHRQMKEFPDSRLIDIYKSFFQDEFGPGHLLSDTLRTKEYFVWELDEMKSLKRYDPEPCGAGKNFVRVPMDLVKDSLVDEEEYFSAFLESAAAFTPPDIDEWRVKWGNILEVVKDMEMELPGMEKDIEAIDKMLMNGQAMVHHSEEYRESYDPHYRIMTLEECQKLLP